MILHVMYSAVRGKQDSYDTMVKALYGHSHVIGKVEGGDNEFVALIRTEREDEASCRYNAQSQCDRLRSFARGWRVVGPFDTTQEIDQLDDFYGVCTMMERVPS